MISSVLYSIMMAAFFVIDIIKLCYRLTNASGSRIFIISFLLIYALSRYFRLKKPNVPKNVIDDILGNENGDNRLRCCDDVDSEEAIGWWPIANRAACLDGLENSRSSIEKCVRQRCRRILLDVEMTKCGQLVILHKQTLKRLERSISSNGVTTSPTMTTAKQHAKSKVMTTDINAINFSDLKSQNIAKNHPLCDNHPPESILHFDDLMQLLTIYEFNAFLLLQSSNKQIVPVILQYFVNNAERTKRIIICSRSPFVIYQLRKQNPNLICALWLDRISGLKLPAIILNSSIFSFAYGLLLRNIVAGVTGIRAVFISKHDFNAHLGQMWRQSDVRPIVYTLNSPSEKRYFQRTLKTQYLTDSLRSEPHHFVKMKK